MRNFGLERSASRQTRPGRRLGRRPKGSVGRNGAGLQRQKHPKLADDPAVARHIVDLAEVLESGALVEPERAGVGCYRRQFDGGALGGAGLKPNGTAAMATPHSGARELIPVSRYIGFARGGDTLCASVQQWSGTPRRPRFPAPRFPKARSSFQASYCSCAPVGPPGARSAVEHGRAGLRSVRRGDAAGWKGRVSRVREGR